MASELNGERLEGRCANVSPTELQAPSCLDDKITASPAEQNGLLQNLICKSIQQLNAKIDRLQGALSTEESKLETMSVKII